MQTILHIADFFAPYSGNFIAEIRVFARAARRRLALRSAIALTTSAAGRDWVPLLLDDGIEVFFIPKPQCLLSAARALASIVSKEDVVILHNHFNRRYEIASAIARALNPRRRVGLVWHRRSDGPFRPKLLTPIKNFIGNRVLAPDVQVIALSDELRDQAILTGIGPQKTSTMFNGIDIDRATSPSRSREEVRRTWGASPSTRVVLHFGWEPTIKGVDLLLGAAKLVSENNAKLMVVMVGWEAMIAAADELLGGDRPAWLRMVPPAENVADFYQAADFLVSTSRYEGFSGCMAEGMSAGLPVLATDIPGVKWASASQGVRFTGLDTSSIAAGLEFMLNSPRHQLIEWSNANRALIKRRYSLESLAETVSTLYSSLCNQRSDSPKLVHEDLV